MMSCKWEENIEEQCVPQTRGDNCLPEIIMTKIKRDII